VTCQSLHGACWQQIASADYSQIELRIMAHRDGDEALLHLHRRAGRAPRDGCRGVRRGADTVSERAAPYAKVINFGLI
jgi:DNA polymerase-1